MPKAISEAYAVYHRTPAWAQWCFGVQRNTLVTFVNAERSALATQSSKRYASRTSIYPVLEEKLIVVPMFFYITF